MDWLTHLDISTLYWLHQSVGSTVMNRFIVSLTTLINCLWLWLAVGITGLWQKRSRWLVVTVIVAVGAAVLIGDGALKHVVMRTRPCFLLSDAPLLMPLPSLHSYSFPSGHSFFFFSGATAIYGWSHRLGQVAYGVALLVAFSRLYLFMHFPSDVLAGAILGILVGRCAYLACRHVQKSITK